MNYQRIAVCLYDPNTETFWSNDDPISVSLKTGYLRTRVSGGLGRAFVWTLKDSDANGTIVKTMAAGLR